MPAGVNKGISNAIHLWESEGGGLGAPASLSPSAPRGRGGSVNKPGCFAKLRNDNGIKEIQIGMKEFECIGATLPHDHPHIYLNMGLSNVILCPYCATQFRYNTALAPGGVMPEDCLYKHS